jgi:hypothetical protein
MIPLLECSLNDSEEFPKWGFSIQAGEHVQYFFFAKIFEVKVVESSMIEVTEWGIDLLNRFCFE